MKDFTTTSFGLMIAYLLPGLVALFGMSAWSENVRKVLRSLFSSQVDGGLLVSIGACALVVGLVLNVFRWITFEKVICKKYKVAPTVFLRSSVAEQLQSFLMVIEETFRYHQFYGSMTILFPFLYLSWLRKFETALMSDSVFLTVTFMFILLEVFLFWVSYEGADGAAEAEWVINVYNMKNARVAVLIAQVVVALLYIVEFRCHFDALSGRYRLLAVTFVFTLGGIAIGANAIASQRRYSERANNLAGDVT